MNGAGNLTAADKRRPYSVGQTAAIRVIRGYKYLASPVIHAVAGPGCGCRFTPTCSQYAIDCVERHGVIAGSALAVRRVLRCAPWHPGGVDPAPGTRAAGGQRPDSQEPTQLSAVSAISCSNRTTAEL